MIPSAWNPTPKQLHQFAWAAPIGLTLLGWMFRRLGAPAWLPYAGLGLGLVLLLVGLTRPLALRFPYSFAMAVATPIGWIVSNVFVAIFYYLLLTPLGLFFRAIGRDPLGLRGKAGATAWSERRATEEATSYYRQG